MPRRVIDGNANLHLSRFVCVGYSFCFSLIEIPSVVISVFTSSSNLLSDLEKISPMPFSFPRLPNGNVMICSQRECSPKLRTVYLEVPRAVASVLGGVRFRNR